MTFEKKRRAMQTTDLLEEVGGVFESIFGDEGGASRASGKL